MILGRMVISPIGLLAALVAGPARATQPETSIFAYGDEAPTARGAEIEALIERDFIAYDPDYLARKAEFGTRLHALAARLAALRASGNEMACSTQIFLETKWLITTRPFGPASSGRSSGSPRAWRTGVRNSPPGSRRKTAPGAPSKPKPVGLTPVSDGWIHRSGT